MAVQLTSQQQQELAAIDWSKIDWAKVLMIVKAILDAFLKQPKQGVTPPATHCEEDCCLHTLCCSMETTKAALEHYMCCCHDHE